MLLVGLGHPGTRSRHVIPKDADASGSPEIPPSNLCPLVLEGLEYSAVTDAASPCVLIDDLTAKR